MPEGQGRRRATMYDVAAAAGVSHQSVSRYVRGIALRESTRVRIEKALETLDYRPNLAARSLITGTSQRIGVVTHQLDQYGPRTVLQGASAAARDAGYLLDIVTVGDGDIAELERALDLLLQHPLAGIIAFTSTDEALRRLEAAELATEVLIAAETDDEDDPQVAAASAGLTALVEHLAGLGHRRFAYISGPSDWAASRNRTRAYTAAVERFGLASTGTYSGRWSSASGSEAAARIVQDGLPDAIIAANDQMALGAVSRLAALGIRVPDQVGVAGIDDMPEAAYLVPALTTVRLDFEAQGRDALRRLLRRLHPDRYAEGATSRRPELVVRDSTRIAGDQAAPPGNGPGLRHQ